ncbi:MAG: HAMP domain-containing histidine kinase [Actinobacteria bacterium]|nr:HAMP domain-containing histidine kinase [Actinomycetota bacterium]MCL5447212.1 HAMP domain-containing histidine kinase [Actinomycetota bacterium]
MKGHRLAGRLMTLRARLLAGIMAVLLAGLAALSVVSFSFMHTFLIGRLDSEVSLAERQGYNYVTYTYIHAVARGDTIAVDNPAAWLALMSDQAGNPSPAPASRSGATPRRSTLDGAAQSGGPLLADASARSGTVPVGRELASRIGPDLYVEVLDMHRSVLYGNPSGTAYSPDPAPVLPAHLYVRSFPRPYNVRAAQGAYKPASHSFQAGAVSAHGAYYRGQAVEIPGGLLVVLAPLASVNATLASLVRVELLVSFVVLLIMVVAGFWVVRVGLAPLDGMTRTAREITAGDLNRRIDVHEDRSEVSSLATALNGMLDQIQHSFEERNLAQDRLRQFMADVSHELRTPLTTIRGYAQLLGKGALADDAERSQAVGRIDHEAQRMTLLVNDLMLLARLDHDRPLDARDVDMARVVNEAVGAIRAAYPDRVIDASAKGHSIVFGDAERLRQVVDNLLHNAATHTPAGTPIHVTLEESGGSLVLAVVDEGYGLSEDELQEVFDRFHKAPGTGGSEGMGLGLSIVAAIAAAHGGRAWAESPPGEMRGEAGGHDPQHLPGAAFKVALPIRV